MRIVLLSDSHGRKSKVLDIIERHKDNADLFLFLGDGNSDIDEALMLYPSINIDRVSGNCDFSSPYPAAKFITFEGKKILFTHGHPYYVKHGYSALIQEAESNKVDFCFFGHTHIQLKEHIGSIYYVNPGTASTGSYAVVDVVKGQTNIYFTNV